MIREFFKQDQVEQYREENLQLKEELEREKSERNLEKVKLSKRLDEEIKKSEGLAQEVADQQGENHLLKKKHLISLKVLIFHLICFFWGGGRPSTGGLI